MVQIRNNMHVSEAHKSFITTQLDKLSDYDALRPKGHVYEFHLHSERVAQSMKSLAKHMGYNDCMCETLYWATLPHDIGKMALPIHIWDLEDKPTDEQRQERRSHTWRGVEIIKSKYRNEYENDRFLKLMIDIMQNHHECVDGSGYQSKTAKDLTKEVRMACICDAFDGYSVFRPHFANRDISPKAVIARMEIEKAGQYDSVILKLFKEIKL